MPAISITNPTNHTVRSPFRGRPPTKVTVDSSGKTRITVQLGALTPLRARLSLYTAMVASAALFLSGAYGMAFDGTFTVLAFAKLTAISIVSFPVSWMALRQLIKRTVSVNFTASSITVRKPFGRRIVERAHPHSFVLLPHDKAEKEQDRHAFLDRKHPPKWWSWNRRKYYGDSFHVALECFGERYDILTVHGLKKATAFQARLQACDAVMDGADFGDNGVSLSPDTDWRVEAGGL